MAMAYPSSQPEPEIGLPMTTADPTYLSSAAYKAGASEAGPDCEFPGFDMLASPEALLGRWVRSPSKFVGWDTYMEFFGLKGDKALQETEEPQEHVILSFSKKELRILHRLPWRDGLDCEYTLLMDGSWQPVPPAMVARASSSWKVNDLATWSHAWDFGEDGNPLHRGLRTEQKLCIGGVNYALRYWRNLIRPDEIRVNVEVTYVESGKYAVHTQRFFRKICEDRIYAIAGLSAAPAPIRDVCAEIRAAATCTHSGRGVRLVMLPHECNMPSDWQKLDETHRWECAEPFPTAGRSSGAFLSSLREAARDARVWVCCGVVLRVARGLLRGVALIGADGWLHAVCTDAAPPADGPYVPGAGDWPATQQARPRGVYDTELGRLAVFAGASDVDLASADVLAMGADLILVPPPPGAKPSRVAVQLPDPKAVAPHSNLTKYEFCGPEPLPRTSTDKKLHAVVIVGENGILKKCNVRSSPKGE